jgi:hypothetical protein
MAKKNKKKARKILRDQFLKETRREEAKVEEAKIAESPEKVDSEIVAVRKDIKKILITVGALVVIIVAIYLVNIKTDVVLKFGNYLAKTLNVQV